MYGNNDAETPLLKGEGKQLDVVEIFSTIQGEGPCSGLPATFVRLAGCHLRCYFCDTDFTSKRTLMTLPSIVSQLGNAKLVVLTGGEPMRQNIVPLCTLLAANHQVQIETSGSFWPEGDYGNRLHQLALRDQVMIVVSPKTAFVHEMVRRTAVAWKYIVTADTLIDDDGLPISNTQYSHRHCTLARPPDDFFKQDVYLQPCDHSNPEHDLVNKGDNKVALSRAISLCQRHGYRLSLQLHKIIGLP